MHKNDATNKGEASEEACTKDYVHEALSEGAHAETSLLYYKDGTPQPKDYILKQLKVVEGMSMDEAVSTLHKDSKGMPQPYHKKDLNYDVECGSL